MKRTTVILGGLAVGLAACAPAAVKSPDDAKPAPFPSTYQAGPADTVLIRGGTVLTGDGRRIDHGDVLLKDGKIVAVGQNLAPGDARVVDAANRWVTPGIIDAHSHLGVYASPGVWANAEGNELTAPVTAEVWAEHSIWPQDPGFQAARELGGVTAMMVIPGSGNLIGGRGVVLKNVPAVTYQAMKFPGAPHVLKMACGENPRRVYGRDKSVAPMTRMGSVAGYRAAFAKAQGYQRKWEDWEKNKKAKGEPPPDRDLQMETLVGVLKGEILVHNHCYRADEMALMLDVAKEAGYKIQAFHHAIEAYKIAPLLAQTQTCAAMWADWWGFKLEAFDGIRENVAMVHAAQDGANAGCAIVHSDSEYGIQRLNQEAAKALAAGRRAGLGIAPEQAIRWITSNPARTMGIGERSGTLRPGLDADVVIWSGDPFSVYALPEQVYIDGVLHHDRRNPKTQPDSDFKLGLIPGSAR